ncbi:hypothetical protein DFJ67_7122 [Asanoa ferruginea]|uniref:Uncharacterized protein n=1 Tax=Asanoa ferruginea TaxID=53367 RepID=A0A3D9ZUJ6_9ACTN|nr:hypothetical protein [Asanoa ferruginea]REG01049.1 hypothetical protein DFJ67_7122 [Asanoa ferruginea]GIF53670.1 hypothetical protein Afe04nite_82090 [Asanoa ferruginea]
MAILRHDLEFFSLCLDTDGVEAFLRLDGDIDVDCVEALNDAVGHLT